MSLDWKKFDSSKLTGLVNKTPFTLQELQVLKKKWDEKAKKNMEGVLGTKQAWRYTSDGRTWDAAQLPKEDREIGIDEDPDDEGPSRMQEELYDDVTQRPKHGTSFGEFLFDVVAAFVPGVSAMKQAIKQLNSISYEHANHGGPSDEVGQVQNIYNYGKGAYDLAQGAASVTPVGVATNLISAVKDAFGGEMVDVHEIGKKYTAKDEAVYQEELDKAAREKLQHDNTVMDPGTAPPLTFGEKVIDPADPKNIRNATAMVQTSRQSPLPDFAARNAGINKIIYGRIKD